MQRRCDSNELNVGSVASLTGLVKDTNKVSNFIQMFTIFCVSLAQIISIINLPSGGEIKLYFAHDCFLRQERSTTSVEFQIHPEMRLTMSIKDLLSSSKPKSMLVTLFAHGLLARFSSNTALIRFVINNSPTHLVFL